MRYEEACREGRYAVNCTDKERDDRLIQALTEIYNITVEDDVKDRERKIFEIAQSILKQVGVIPLLG